MKLVLDGSNGGYFGEFGGCWAPEILRPVLERVEGAYQEFLNSKEHQAEFRARLHDWAGRPTPMYQAVNFARKIGLPPQVEVWVKREDLIHGGAHKTNNVIGQGILATIMGAKALIAETGAGQHGIATAMIGARLGLPVKIFMGQKDVVRQQVNVERMKLLGAEVVSVTQGSQSLKDAINEAMRYWISHQEDTYYVFGTAAGPHPFPSMVAYFHQVIGEESRAQFLELTGALPQAVLACVGGGSNAIGLFQGFLEDPSVCLIGVEPAGDGKEKHGLTLNRGRYGCLHGSLSLVNCTAEGQIEESHSVSAGLDYPGVSPIHAFLQTSEQATYIGINDDEAITALQTFSRSEGIIPALESAHALGALKSVAKQFSAENPVRLLVGLSGRGDKDLSTVERFVSEKKPSD